MDFFQLPDRLVPNSEASIQIFDYKISNPNIKNKIILNKNVFSFLMEGTKELITHEQTKIIDHTNFLMVKSGNCLMSESLSPSNTYRSMLLFFPDEAIDYFIEKYKITINKSSTVMPYQVCKYDQYTVNFVESLKQINHYDLKLQKTILQNKFEEIMLYLVHLKGSDFLGTFSSISRQKLQFISVVESNIHNNLNLQELAFLSNKSISSFKREFEKHYKASPIKWFLDKRLDHSAYLLKYKKMRPTEIYTEVGFESLSSFTQSFKQKFGVTPKKFQISN